MIEAIEDFTPAGSPARIPVLDHFVYACVDVDASAREFADASGVEPILAGVHPDFNTKMYLARVGDQAYLEFTGLDRTKARPNFAPFGLLDLSASRMVAWSIRNTDLPSAIDAASAIDVDYGGVRNLRRLRPDGKLLKWQLASPDPKPFDGIGPFLIDWKDSPHPSGDSETRVELVDFSSRHPHPDQVRSLLDIFDISMRVDEGPPRLSCVFRSAKGLVHLS